MLRRLLETKGFIRIIEAHSPLAGLIIENTKLQKHKNDKEYDGMWSSSLTEVFNEVNQTINPLNYLLV